MNVTGSVSPERRRRAVAMALLAAAAFSVTFVLNRRMSDQHGHPAWSAALRFLMMLPVLALIVVRRGKSRELRNAWKASPAGWILWGTIGSGIFYSALTAAGAVSPAWVVAGTWPVSIVIGILLAPLLYADHRRRIPRRALFYSAIVLAGIAAIQFGRPGASGDKPVLPGLILILISATAHPVGNRGSMLLMERRGLPADAYVRLVALITGSLPFLAGLCLWGYLDSGLPSAAQLTGSAFAAACGCVATPLFYAAADGVARDSSALAAVEATQATEMIFTLIFEACLLGLDPPGPVGIAGMGLVIAGIMLHARTSPKETSLTTSDPASVP